MDNRANEGPTLLPLKYSAAAMPLLGQWKIMLVAATAALTLAASGWANSGALVSDYPTIAAPTDSAATIEQAAYLPPPELAAQADEVSLGATSDVWCPPSTEPPRTSSWTIAFEVIPSEIYITDRQFGRWNDNDAGAGRLILGYEDPDGLGLRARFWGLGQDASLPADDVELSMGKFDLDLYKRVFFDRGEIALGGGGSSAALEFQLADGAHSRFEGGGGTMFAEGYYTLQEFEKSELGAVGRARYSILFGDWRDTTGGLIVPTTNSDSLSVVELGWGLEYRRRFGPCEDHSWFLGLLFEYQRWQSDWMANYAGTSVGIAGIDIYTGLNW